jgi:alginate O-acetyltransferase complex protein AlgI
MYACARVIPELPAWGWMWVYAVVLFLAAKGVTVASLNAPNPRRLWAYLLLWPGLDAQAFCGNARPVAPAWKEFRRGLLNMIAGGLLLIAAMQLEESSLWYVAGWLGMIAVILILHFGCFLLLSIYWRARGVDAQPVMRSPITAASLSKLWSGRWNTAFTALMHAHVFKPTAKRFGVVAGTVTVFALSGILHEAVISVPAGTGYGLPTVYFLLQCGGVLMEKSAMGRRLGLGGGLRGRMFAFAIAGSPIFILFPPSFVANVVIPMIKAIEHAIL